MPQKQRTYEGQQSPSRSDDTSAEQHECGPWIECSSSSVARFRYDYANNSMHVIWRIGRGTTYTGVPPEVFTAFTKSRSKGRSVSVMLDPYGYHRITPQEVDAPSSRRRK